MTNANKAMTAVERYLVIVVSAFAVVLVSVTWVGIAVALRVAGGVHVLDVLGGLLGPVVRHGQKIK